jgi:hypothetical protein
MAKRDRASIMPLPPDSDSENGERRNHIGDEPEPTGPGHDGRGIREVEAPMLAALLAKAAHKVLLCGCHVEGIS